VIIASDSLISVIKNHPRLYHPAFALQGSVKLSGQSNLETAVDTKTVKMTYRSREGN
jgi:hypothetical protein